MLDELVWTVQLVILALLVVDVVVFLKEGPPESDISLVDQLLA